MGIIADIILVAIILLFTFIGYKRGLVKVVISLIAFVLAIVIALIFYKPVSKIIIEKTQIDENISNTLYTNIIADNLEDKQNVIDQLEKYTGENLSESTEENLKNSINSISEKIIEISCIIVIYIVARIALIALKLISGIIASLPIIKQFNELGGAIYGILQGLFIVYGVLAIVFILSSSYVNADIIKAIESSYICRQMYLNNIILNILF